MPEQPTEKKPLIGKVVVEVSVGYFDGCNIHPIHHDEIGVPVYAGDVPAQIAEKTIRESAASVRQVDILEVVKPKDDAAE